MRICGMAAEGLRSERRIHESFPLKELMDYWSSRPKYEEIESYSETSVAGSSASGSGSKTTDENGQSYQEWLATQNDDKDEPPPPPYTLTAEEEAAGRPVQQSTTTTAPVAPTPAQPSPTSVHAAPSRHPTVGASAAPPSQFSNPNNFPPQQQRPHLAVEPVADLTSDFAQASISGSPLPQNAPGAAGVTATQQSYSPGPDSMVSSTNASGPWSTAQWPPKEWGVNSGAPANGANLVRLHTFSAPSSNPAGANLRPSATVGGRPVTPVHKPPHPNPGSGGSSPPLTHTGPGGYRPPHITMPDHPPAGFPDRPPASPLGPPGGFGPSNYAPGPYSPGRPSFPDVPTSSFGPAYPGPSTYGGPPSPPAGGPFPNQPSYLYNGPQQYPPFNASGGPFDNRIPLAPPMNTSGQYPPPGPAYHDQYIPHGGYPGGPTYPQPMMPMPMGMPPQPPPPRKF